MLSYINNSKKIFSLSIKRNLANHAYWLSELDKKLINVNLDELEAEHIYKVIIVIFFLIHIFFLIILDNLNSNIILIISKLSFDRGINATNYSVSDLIECLKLWLKFSSSMDLQANRSRLFMIF
jgi:hypothetical protein